MSLAPGDRLGAFEILAPLGAGGMGEVYRAHDTRLERDVALKVLPAETLGSVDARARLLREARMASRINHPNVCTIHEVGEANGRVFIAMELVEGWTLAGLLAGGALPREQVLRYGVQITEALAHAHERGVVHRDLKSANIVVTPDGRAKVLDFGLARKVLPEDPGAATTMSQASLTGPGTIAGTLAYMAPEQLRGQPADARSDIWALGVVLYEMAAGRRPFAGRTGYELSSAILGSPPPPLPPVVSPPLSGVIERCLAKEPGRRFQRAGEVRAALEIAGAGGAPPNAVPAASDWPRRRRLVTAAVLALAAATAVLLDIGSVRRRLTGGTAAPALESLAVLPFENLSGDPEQGYLAAGIHEALITDLAKLSGLKRVIARASAVRYENTDKPLSQVARELGVRTLMTGSVQRSGSRVRVSAHLVDPRTDEQVWSDSFDRELRDVLSLQSEIVSAITRQTRLHLSPEDRERLASAPTVNPQSYEAYLKGMFWIHKLTPQGFEKGLAYLQEAIDKDPTSPQPYAALALGYCLIGHERFPDAFDRARVAARKAQELGGALAETQEALAEIEFYSDWDLEAAGRSLQEALRLDPSLAEAHRHYSWYLNVTGRRDEALLEIRRAEELDPLTPTYPGDVGWQLWMMGRYEEALVEARKSLELNPSFPVGLTVVGLCRASQGRFDDAIAAHRQAAAASPVWRWPLARTYALAGRREEALALAAELEKAPGPLDTWGLATAYTALGNPGGAFLWLQRALEARFSWMPWVGKDPFFEPLYSDPRFADVLRRIATQRHT